MYSRFIDHRHHQKIGATCLVLFCLVIRGAELGTFPPPLTEISGSAQCSDKDKCIPCLVLSCIILYYSTLFYSATGLFLPVLYAKVITTNQLIIDVICNRTFAKPTVHMKCEKLKQKKRKGR